MTAGSSQRTGGVFGRRLICEEEDRRPGPPWGGTGGWVRKTWPQRDAIGGVRQLVVRSGPVVHLRPRNCGRGPRLLYALEMSAIRKSLWAAARRRFWHGLWYDHGASPCWKLSPGSNIWICGWG